MYVQMTDGWTDKMATLGLLDLLVLLADSHMISRDRWAVTWLV